MRSAVWVLGMVALGAPALAQDAATPPAVAPSVQGDVSVTIYSNDLGLIQDVRPLDLAAGRVRQDFPDVSAAIKPETVALDVPDAQIVEQNFDYDLLSPSSLMEKAVGETITVVRTNPGTGAETRERAKVLAVNDGVVLQIGDHVEVLRDDGLPARAIFDRVPENLRARPTLSVTLDAKRAGRRQGTLSYLSGKLGWSADYVALFDRAKGVIDVQGWVTLRNDTGTTFTNARTLLVAGSVAGSGDDDGDGPQPRRFGPQRPGPVRQAGTETAQREQLGDFYLYPLPGRTTIADKQTKQVSFLDVKGAPATAGYEYRADWLENHPDPESAASVLRLSTARGAGLGDALPAGTVRVYQRDERGQPQFTGESQIPHTPQGSMLVLRTGDAFDVKVKTTLVEHTVLSSRRWRTRMSYTLTNARAAPVTVDLVQAGLDWDDTRILEESQASERRDAEAAVWHVPVPANGEATVTATFDTRY